MTPAGQVKAAKQAKFRQVNRFLEFVDDVLPELPATGVLRVIDFGCGKSYLTFALHYLLTELRGRKVEIIGLDLKAEVVRVVSGLPRRLVVAACDSKSATSRAMRRRARWTCRSHCTPATRRPMPHSLKRYAGKRK